MKRFTAGYLAFALNLVAVGTSNADMPGVTRAELTDMNGYTTSEDCLHNSIRDVMGNGAQIDYSLYSWPSGWISVTNAGERFALDINDGRIRQVFFSVTAGAEASLIYGRNNNALQAIGIKSAAAAASRRVHEADQILRDCNSLSGDFRAYIRLGWGFVSKLIP